MSSIFLPPQATAEQLSSIILTKGEIVFNTTNEQFCTFNNNEKGYVDFITSDKLDKTISSSTTENFDIILNYVSDLQNQIFDLRNQIFELKSPNIQNFENIIEITDNTVDAVISSDTVITTNEIPTSISNITANSINIKSLFIDSIRLNMMATNDVKITNIVSIGNLDKSISNASISINTNGYILIKDCEINQSGYNAIEIGSNKSSRATNITIDNVYFKGVFSNNCISIFDTDNDVVVNISNCKFDQCSNPIRISNRSNNKLTLNIVNCEFDKWEGDFEGSSEQYAGMILCQDYTSGSSENEILNNLFGPDKIKINIINCIHNGKKIESKDASEICGSHNINQLLYLYFNHNKLIDYDINSYPTLTIK